MKKIKICHMTSAHDSYDSRIFQTQCVGVAQNRNFEVYLVARGSSRYDKNVNVVGIGNNIAGRIKRMFIITKKIYKKALEIDADIYEIHDPELLPYAKKLIRRGKKVIFDSHEDTTTQIRIKTYIPSIIRNIIAKMYYCYESRITKKIDGVIFPCPIYGKHPFENRANNIIFISNVPFFNKNDDKIKNKKIDENEKLTFCYVGGLTEDRGVTNLLRAFQATKDKFRLIVAGPLTDEYKRYLEAEQLLNGVDYRGMCSSEEVSSIYDESFVGISNLLNIGQYPTLGTFPTKVFEYMAKALAVIVSDYPFSREFIEKDKIGILIDPSDYNELVKAMEYMHDNRDQMFDMGKNGLKLAEERYNWQVECKRLEKFYYKILNI